MSEEKTDGVLLKGAGGANYFIPQTELTQFAVAGDPDPEGKIETAAPRVDAFSVRRAPVDAEDEGSTAFLLAAEQDSAEMLAAEDDSAEMLAAEDDSAEMLAAEDDE